MRLLTRVVNGTATVFGLLGLLLVVVALWHWVQAVLRWGPQTFATALTWTVFALLVAGGATVIDHGGDWVASRLGGE